MNRFLSRREKHPGKRSSKNNPPKVRTPPPSPSSQLQLPTVDGSEPVRSLRRRADSLQTLYHKLPSILPYYGGENAFFVRQKPHCPHLLPFHAESSTTQSSVYVQARSQSASSDHHAIFSKDAPKSADKDDEKKVKALVQRLHSAGITSLGESQAYCALSMHPDDLDKAYEALLLANDAFDGTVVEYSPNVKMLGAVNRNMVTCYLDALLFAMFARLDSFEAMLFDNFQDEPRKKLAAILRLWVNLLRTGRLIGVDLTEHLQGALADCGWEEAAEVCQQDASEAFTFITGVLELPLLTLKMDIYHTGREDKEDDHKFVNERLLEVAIPEQEGEGVVTLESCLESYFNNRIEVKRYLQRQNTMSSMRSTDRDPEKNQTLHIETVQVSASNSPIVTTPTSLPPTPLTPISPIRPQLEGRRRADSIFSERYRNANGRSSEQRAWDEKKHLDDLWKSSSDSRPRSNSLRKEVLMPAWQFFSLIPWYTDNVPKSDAQVAAHFSAQRPVLGICLKRYMMLEDGSSKRLNTYIDIPLEIGLPHFVSDDRIDDNGPLFGNFKLVLQSVVCHRGVSIHSGHYIALIRGNTAPHSAHAPQTAEGTPQGASDSWFIFDDLAQERIKEVDIQQALQDESPYLLFFQVQPIDEELASRGDPPGYSETEPCTAGPSQEMFPNSHDTGTAAANENGEQSKPVDPTAAPEDTAGRSSMSSNRPSSITFDIEDSIAPVSRGRTAPPTPLDDKPGFLSTSRRNSKAAGETKSRPSSQSGESRLSLTLSRLTGRTSKDKLVQTVVEGFQSSTHNSSTSNPNSDDPLILVHSVKSGEGEDPGQENPTTDTSTGHKEKHHHYYHNHAHNHNHNHSTIGRSKSKKGKEKDKDKDKDKDNWKRLRSKSKDHADPSQRKSRPDRECVVM